MEKKALHVLVKKAAHSAFRKSVIKKQIKTAAFEAKRKADLRQRVKTAALNLAPPPGGWNNAAMGAVLGGIAGLGREAVSGKHDKNYLKAMILHALVGGGLGLASSYMGAPDMWKKTKPYLAAGKNRIIGAFNGAKNP